MNLVRHFWGFHCQLVEKSEIERISASSRVIQNEEINKIVPMYQLVKKLISG